MPQSKRGSQVLPTKVAGVAYEERPANPDTQNMVSHSSTLGCLFRASHRATDQEVVWISRDRDSPVSEGLCSFGSSPERLLDVQLIAAIFNLLRLLGDPPFVSVNTENNF